MLTQVIGGRRLSGERETIGSLYTVWAISCKTAQKQGTQVWCISVIREVEVEGLQFLQPLALLKSL